MTHLWKILAALTTGLLLLLIGLGCVAPSTPVVYHTLQATQTRSEPATPTLAVEVLRVRIPEVLQRPQIVLSMGLGAVELTAGHRWGNPLERDMQRVLVADLGQFLGSDRVVAAPGGPAVGATYLVEVEVLRCQGRPGGTLHFLATWMVTHPGAIQALVLARTELNEPVTGVDTQALVAAHERVLALLSAEIGTRLRAQP